MCGNVANNFIANFFVVTKKCSRNCFSAVFSFLCWNLVDFFCVRVSMGLEQSERHALNAIPSWLHSLSLKRHYPFKTFKVQVSSQIFVDESYRRWTMTHSRFQNDDIWQRIWILTCFLVIIDFCLIDDFRPFQFLRSKTFFALFRRLMNFMYLLLSSNQSLCSYQMSDCWLLSQWKRL